MSVFDCPSELFLKNKFNPLSENVIMLLEIHITSDANDCLRFMTVI